MAHTHSHLQLLEGLLAQVRGIEVLPLCQVTVASTLHIPAQVEVVGSRYIQAHMGKPPPEELEDLFVIQGDIFQLGLTASLATLISSAGNLSANGGGHNATW